MLKLSMLGLKMSKECFTRVSMINSAYLNDNQDLYSSIIEYPQLFAKLDWLLKCHLMELKRRTKCTFWKNGNWTVSILQTQLTTATNVDCTTLSFFFFYENLKAFIALLPTSCHRWFAFRCVEQRWTTLNRKQHIVIEHTDFVNPFGLSHFK